MSLQELPNEILLAIASSLDSEADINSFSHINNHFHTLLTPFLYEYNVTHSDASALRWAGETGQLSTARRALDAGAQFRATYQTLGMGVSFLGEVIFSGSKEVFELLLEHIASTSAPGSAGINMHKALVAKDIHEWTPLLFAASYGHPDIVRIILEKGINPNTTDSVGRTPLFLACAAGETDCVDALLEHPNIDTDIPDNDGTTPIFEAVREKNVDMVVALLARGARPGHPLSPHIETPLHRAVLNGHREMIQLLIGRDDVHPNAIFDNYTALKFAVHSGFEDGVEMLLGDKRTNPDLNVVPDGGTPLFWALVYGHERMVKLLLDAGANPNICNWQWVSPAMLMEVPNV